MPVMPNSITQIQEEIADEFAYLERWEDKYEYIIDLGKKLPTLSVDKRVETFQIKGCQSQVWIVPEQRDGRLYFEGDSDSTIVRGLVAMVLRVLSGHEPKEIAGADLFFPQRIGMDRHLAATRSNGLAAMVKQIRQYGSALAGNSQGN
jgi:cysteine desulfuration protein SufE